MRQIKHKTRKRQKLILGTVITLLIIAGVAVAIFYHSNVTERERVSDESVAEASLFAFSSDKVSGWREGPSNRTSMAAFGSGELEGCFVSAEYIQGKMTSEQGVAEMKQEVEASGMYQMIEGEEVTATLEASGGDKEYDIHFSTIKVPNGAEAVKEGQAFGFVQLDEGYVKLMGLCDEAGQVEKVVPALEAFSIRTS